MPERSSVAVPAAIFLVAGASLLLAACASTVMKSYIGAPITSVMLDYGPPDNIYSLGPGQQAYQWRKNKTQAVAGSSSGEVRTTRRGERYEVSKRRAISSASIVIIRSTPAIPAANGM